MDRVCQFSTVIFAGNVSVLIVVAVMTDYWEYRGFNFEPIKKVPNSNTTQVVDPIDTDSYLLIRYFWDARARLRRYPEFPTNNTFFQSPALVYKFFTVAKMTADSNNNSRTLLHVKHGMRKFEEFIILYVQYGNLFRNCDSLEAGVRVRLGLDLLRTGRCQNFITAPHDGHYIHTELPAVIHLERTAFVFAVTCIVASIASVAAGCYGSLVQDQFAILTASTTALISGMTLTIAIALFHGKCHLLHRREFMAGLDIPYKKIINDSRVHYYGWSFVLAWICVVLCFIHSWVWLRKSQDMQIKYSTRKGRVHHIARDGLYGDEFVYLTS